MYIVKGRSYVSRMDKNISVLDLSMYPKLNDEDTAFSIDPDLLKNIRRGNTILEISSSEGEVKRVIGRKGLVKFFDMSIDYLSP
jgi:hypothetical protein